MEVRGAERRMIRLDQVRLPVEADAVRDPLPLLVKKAASLLGIPAASVKQVTVVRHSVDARKKPQLFDVYTIDVRADIPEKGHGRGRAGKAKFHPAPAPVTAKIPASGSERMEHAPVVTGAGPAGLFSAWRLAQAGYRPVVIERGDDTVMRDRAVQRFWEDGALDAESNLQFGLGGAGAYSDGKLYTGVSDPDGVRTVVLDTLVAMGAPADIRTEAHPHVGTDVLKTVMEHMRDDIVSAGGRFLFRTRVEAIENDGNGRVFGVTTTAGSIAADAVILAIGHSARDTMETLCGQGVSMEQKPFAVGFRVAHPQALIDRAQYGRCSGPGLAPAVYKLTGRGADGRPVYSFCMCPGGRIVNASSEPERTCVNGMSYRARDGQYANSAIVAAVTPDDYRINGHPMEGVAFQRRLEERAFALGRGRIPVSSYRDFAAAIAGDPVKTHGDAALCEALSRAFCGLCAEADLAGLLPRNLEKAIAEAMTVFGTKIRGFDGPEAILAGVESRTSSPVRIPRGEDRQSVSHPGLYPCGEGAGYAGGIMSAAMDGIRTADAVIARFGRPAANEA